MAHKVLQWNIRSLSRNKQELTFLINRFNPTLCAISETWLNPGSNFRIPGYHCLRDDKTDGRGGGCALLIKRLNIYTQIVIPPHDQNFQIVAVKTLDTTFVSLYIPYPNSQIIRDLSSILSSLPRPLVICGDFNCHNTLWGSHYNDAASSLLLDLLDDVNLCILNDGSPTRRSSPVQNASIPDLSLCSPQLAPSIPWRVLSGSYGSDHFPILLTLPQNCTPPPSPSPLFKYKTAQADWDKYSRLLEEKTSHTPVVDNDNMLFLYNEFINSITSAAENSIPLKSSPKTSIPSPPWWDSDCSTSVRERNEAEKSFSRSTTMENFLHLQKTSAKTRRLLSKKKTAGWRDFCESLSPRSSSSIVWRKLRTYRGSCNNTDTSSNDPNPWIHDFINNLAPPHVPTFDSFPSPQTSACPPDPMNEPFSFSELECALSGLKDSTPGIDGIPYSFICKASDTTKSYLLSILNQIFISGIVPETWKSQIIIPILKPGKDPSLSSSYRPIALSSVLAKIMEHLINNRLTWFVESRGLISKRQFGFRRGKGTIDSLSILTTEVRLAFSRNEHLIGVFLDVNSAYDRVQLPILRSKLLKLNIPARLVTIICNMLMARLIHVRVNGSLLPPHMVWQGLPQGSVLSPILYNLYTYDLDLSVDSLCQILQYADDIALYCSSESFDECVSRLNSALTYLDDWLSEHGLSLSVSKCSAVVFSRKRNIPPINLHVRDMPINTADQVKFLGLILDSKMSGLPHLNYICNKCEKNVNILRAISGVRWGSHPYTLKLIYNAIIRSHFDYGGFLLEPCSRLALAKLDRIQSKCLRFITGSMKSSPTIALQVECLEPPLNLRRQYLSNRYMCNIFQLQSHPLHPILQELSSITPNSNYWTNKSLPLVLQSFNKIQNSNFPIERFEKPPLFTTSFETLMFTPKIILDFGIQKNSPRANEIFNKIISKDWQDWITIFTDASKEDNCNVGSAVWIPNYSIILSFKCSPLCSIFTGESIALLEAISFVESNHLTKVLIFSDSLSSLQDLLKFPLSSRNNFPVILKIREVLFHCASSGMEIVLAWIPSHSGIAGNETVDSLARDASTTGCTTYNRTYCRDLIISTRPNLISNWNNMWQINRQIKAKWYGNIQPEIPVKPWFNKYKNMEKWITSVIIRLRLGHVTSPVFLAKIRVRDNSLCECGLAEGTLEHIFFECPHLTVHLYDILPPKIPRPVNIPFLLTLVHSPLVSILYKFINLNNIKL